MVASFIYQSIYRQESGRYCGSCGREMQEGAGTQGRFFYCHHGEGVSGTMPVHSGMFSYNESHEELSQQQKNKIALIEMNNQKMKQGWKRDQYAKGRGQFRI